MAFHSGEVGLGYAPVTLQARGGLPPYDWHLATGSLPSGLSLSLGGVVSGSVSTPGTFAFSVRVVDAAAAAVTGNATVIVYSALTMTEPCATKCVVGNGCSKCGSFGTVSKGLAPYSYKLVAGAIPKGMTWSGLALKGGFATGNYATSVQVTDKLGANVRVDASWSVYGPALLLKGRTSSQCTNSFNIQVSCSVAWGYSSGNPSVPPKLFITGYSPWTDPASGRTYSPTSPPPGWSVGISGGLITISASYTDPCIADYAGYINFVLRDPSQCATTLPSNTGQLFVDLRYSC
jgi:putative Ig domain-containing protein